MISRETIGVFGGTFDPIHQAHLAVAESARDAFDLRRILFVPAAEPPHKTDWRITPAEQRLAMVEMAIADNPAFQASRMEIDRGGTSYTVDTLTSLRDILGGAPLALILSAESFAGLPTWRSPERVLDLADLIVAPRDGYPDADPGLIARHFPGSRGRATMLDGPRMRLSASEIRARAASGRSVRYLVPDAVAAYIGDHALYRTTERTQRP
ncbi:MAG: nicotinate-nucleotide adenylyltransferase [Candidatus Limnocylindrales bacterium]